LEGLLDSPAPNPRRTRRKFSNSYKASIVREYDSTSCRKERAKIRTRENLSASHISKWRHNNSIKSLCFADSAPTPEYKQDRAVRFPRADYAAKSRERLVARVVHLVLRGRRWFG